VNERRCVLFDLDGTLIDSTELIIDSYRHTLRAVGGDEPSEAWIMEGFGTPLRANLERMGPSPQLVPEMMRIYSEYNAAHHDDKVRPFPGTLDVLRAMAAQGIELGIVTGKRRRYALMGLSLLQEVHVHFRSVVTPERTAHGKPAPDPVVCGLRDLNADPARALFVGDSPHDVAAGKAAGVPTAAAAWGPFPEAKLRAAAPDYWLGSIDAVLSLI
jgi:pyrophosphatase PpaX